MTTVSNDVTLGRQRLRREVNARIRGLTGQGEETTIDVFCECGRRLCADRIRVAVDVYRDVLVSPGYYVVTPHHDHDPTQRLISRHDGFLVVERDDR
jgi:hypothetical protein